MKQSCIPSALPLPEQILACMSEHVNTEVVGLDEGGATLGAEVILGQFDADMSVEDVRLELAFRRERPVVAVVTNKRTQAFVDSLKKDREIIFFSR